MPGLPSLEAGAAAEVEMEVTVDLLELESAAAPGLLLLEEW